MVAVDFSENAIEAFDTVVNLVRKEEDDVIIFSVAEHEIVWLGVLECNASLIDRARKVEHKGTKMNLVNFALRCAAEGIKYKLVMSQGGSIGETICNVCIKYEVNCLVVGRRGMSLQKKIFGSTSKYCVDNVPCSVLVVKDTRPEAKSTHHKLVTAHAEGVHEDLIMGELHKIELFSSSLFKAPIFCRS